MKIEDAMSRADNTSALQSSMFLKIERIATICAVIGGFVLLGMALLTCFSVASRLALNQPIRGIFELVELFTGIAVLSFFPYTHVTRGNVVAEFFTQWLPLRGRAVLELLADIAFLGVAIFAFWRVSTGFVQSIDSIGGSFVLNLPDWVFYGPAAFWMLLLVIVSVAVMVRSAGALLK
jgi:TRAP-type C4-dicarboxylate transport system permease small subunit